jgi:hypothetical protein
MFSSRDGETKFLQPSFRFSPLHTDASRAHSTRPGQRARREHGRRSQQGQDEKSCGVRLHRPPHERLTHLGRDLADGFSRTLASAGGKFALIDRRQVQAIIEKNRVASDVIRDSEIAWWLARQLHANALIVGQLTASGGPDRRAYRTSKLRSCKPT